VLGPSPRLDLIAPLLGALGSGTRRVDDLFALLGSIEHDGQLVVDGDLASLEDLGFFRRFIGRNAGWRVVVLGDDAGRAPVRALLSLDRTRWVAWPPDVVQMQSLVHAGAPTSEISAPIAPPMTSAATPATPASAVKAPVAAPTPITRVSATPVDMRAQVALLADISQRLELSFSALRESGRGAEAEVDGTASELRRLVRFTRTLSCLIAPPARGDEEFNLVALLEDQLAGLTLRGRKGPRFVPRGPGDSRNGELIVRADKNAVSWAVEALLGLARQCAGAGDVVRVLYSPLGADVAVTIEFPAGPLAGLALERFFEPNAVHERLPEFGANDLSASAAILRSQGGDLSVSPTDNGSLALQLRLPLLRQGAPGQPAPARQTPPAARATSNDPFA
jgi:hypothetical protein